MADLTVRDLNEAVVQCLDEEAVRDGISSEEAARRLLRRVLRKDSKKPKLSFKEYLMTMPEFGEDEDSLLERQRDEDRSAAL